MTASQVSHANGHLGLHSYALPGISTEIFSKGHFWWCSTGSLGGCSGIIIDAGSCVQCQQLAATIVLLEQCVLIPGELRGEGQIPTFAIRLVKIPMWSSLNNVTWSSVRRSSAAAGASIRITFDQKRFAEALLSFFHP